MSDSTTPWTAAHQASLSITNSLEFTQTHVSWVGDAIPCLFDLHAEYFMRNAGLDKAQAGIRIAGRIINNLRYVDDTTFMAESEELKSLLMKVKEESEKVGLTIQKTKITASGPITSWQIDEETIETVTDYFFFFAPKSLQMMTAATNLKDACSLEGKLWPT